MKKLLFYCLVLLTVFGCEKKTDYDPVPAPSNYSNAVWVVNQGMFQAGDASLTYYNKVSHTATTDIFSQVNGRPLGDVFQSMSLINGQYYLLVNNSNKIEICDTTTFKNTAEITNVPSPRYMLPVSATKAYISALSFSGGAVSVFDLTQNKITGTIPVNLWTEEMLVANNQVFTTQVFANKVDVIDYTQDKVIDSIPLSGYEPQWIVLDKNNKIWVLCNDEDTLRHIPTLHTIDPVTHKVLNNFSFSPDSTAPRPSALTINATGDTLYFICGGVMKMGINQTSLPSSPFIPKNGRNLFGLGVDPANGNIYASDAIDYIQAGEVYRYSRNGTQIDMFKAGTIPGGFCFPR